MCPHAELAARPRRPRSTRDEDRAVDDRRTAARSVGYDRLVRRARRGRRARSRSRASPSTALGFKSLADAIAAPQPRAAPRSRRRTRRSTRETPGARADFVFVGAGYAGVEALAELSDLVDDALRYYPRLRDAPQRWVLVDAAPTILPEIPPRLGDYAAQAAREARRRDPRRDDARVARRPRRRRSRTASGSRRARSSGRPACARTRSSRELGLPLDERGRVDRRRAPAVEGVERRLGARRLRARAEPRARRTARPADLPARAPPGAAAREEPRAATRSPTATGCSARSRRSAATRESPTCSACACAASPAGSSPARTTCTSCRSLSRKLRVVMDWTVALFFRRDIAELGTLGHPRAYRR